MPTIAKLRQLRIAPRKVRQVSDLIRGKSVQEASAILTFTTNRAAPVLQKLLKSAASSAKNQLQLDESNLRISRITVDEGPKLKRWMPRARGSASAIQKKTSHITLMFDAMKPAKIKKLILVILKS
jgi:large subunit ribosomal protein L22